MLKKEFEVEKKGGLTNKIINGIGKVNDMSTNQRKQLENGG